MLERFEHGRATTAYTLIDCKLFTGRTHQIRVHLEYAKHPLVGDPAYTSGAPSAPAADLGLDRQFLHSFQLSFQHPVTGEGLRFADNLPSDLQEALDDLASRSTGPHDGGGGSASVAGRRPEAAAVAYPFPYTLMFCMRDCR